MNDQTANGKQFRTALGLPGNREPGLSVLSRVYSAAGAS